MEHNGKASVPPEQRKGVQKDLEETVELETQEDAEDMFVIAKKRLLDVNRWHHINRHIQSEFQITDAHGRPLQRQVHKGDYISIDVPGPGPVAGEGKDWVKVEALEYDDYPDDNRELMGMRLRPARSPLSEEASVSHFFSAEATSTFIIERKHRLLTASYHGRNEVPNTGAEHLTDKARNLVVAAAGILGFSDANWSGLLKGFIAIEEGI